ncbi:VC0807 family protein [Jeotgalibacillus sp. JSM ZJ347]|uniref:VC0807 family protein n=1 Tax=Jeotgalibacillus sp. JSM ZJ347 TaxID=3342117 RepID=UPI0035A997CB
MRKIAFLDIIFYVAIPYFLWTYGRDPLGDYYAMLLSTVPGFAYTIYRFIVQKQFNMMGLFIIGSLIISTSVNILSSNAENMLWNQVYLGYLFASVYLLSMIFKRPLALTFAIDFAFLQGYPRENSKTLYSTQGIFMWFQLLTLLFFLRGLFQNTFKAWLISNYGVNGYDQMLIYLSISGWIFNGLIFAGFIFISSKIYNFLEGNDFQFPVNHPE